jgi:hypothetical protein
MVAIIEKNMILLLLKLRTLLKKIEEYSMGEVIIDNIT